MLLRRSKINQITSEVIGGCHKVGEQVMTPDGSVMWDVHRVSNLEGVVIVPQNPSAEAIDLLARLALRDPTALLKMGATGQNGRVRLSGDVAVKTFFRNDAIASGLPALQANVALHAGLQRVGHPDGWHVTAPAILGAHLPEEKSAKPTWVMTREWGSFPDLNAASDIIGTDGRIALDYVTRRTLYSDAVEACGHQARAFAFDDKGVENMMVRPSEISTRPPLSELVKFDVMAHPYNFVSNPDLALAC